MPFWEVLGNPVNNSIKFTRNTRNRGHRTLSVPVEFWTNPTRREGILGKSREEDQGGSLQIDFGDGPKVTLRRGTGSWKAFVWDPETAKLLPRGVSSFSDMISQHKSQDLGWGEVQSERMARHTDILWQ